MELDHETIEALGQAGTATLQTQLFPGVCVILSCSACGR